MIHVSAAKGLGDAIYLRAIVLQMLDRGDEVTVHTTWPDVFLGLPVKLKAQRDEIPGADWHLATACLRCRLQITQSLDQFRMAAMQAGLENPGAPELRWKVTDLAWLEGIKRASGGRPIMLYQPLKRSHNEVGRLLRPDVGAFAARVSSFRDEFYRIKVGHPDFLEDDPRLECEMNLFGKTSVAPLIDLATIAEQIFCEVSALLGLAQCLRKRVVCMFSRKASESPYHYPRNVNPLRMFALPDLAQAVYDEAA